MDSGSGDLNALRQFDAFEAVRRAQLAEGRFELARLSRLLDGLPERQPGEVQWSVAGIATALGRQQLDLQVQAPVQLVCQSCLQPFEHVLQSRVLLDLVATEDELDEGQDGGVDESASGVPVDRIVCRGRLDLLAQIEDELILALPYIARHEVCPQPLPHSAGEATDTGRRHPFAALAKLQQAADDPGSPPDSGPAGGTDPKS